MNDCFGSNISNTYHTPISVQCALFDILPRENLIFVMLALPNSDTNEKFGAAYNYYCITDDWKERMKSNDNTITYQLPKMVDVSY